MTIYFKNGETLHIAGEQGERVKRMVADYVMKMEKARIVIVMNEDRVGEVDLILDIEEIAAMR